MKFRDKKEATEYLVDTLNCIPSRLILDAWEYASQKDLCGEDSWQIIDSDNYGDIDFPMWGWVWGTSDSGWISDDWVEEHIKDLQDIGFTVIHHDEYGYFLGIDGAGYDFYKHHWTPLYDLLGLKWVEE